MSNIATTSPQLRRRKSKMVPHASQKRKDPLPKDTDADENPMELNEFISPSAMADKGDLQVWSNHSLGRTFLDTGDIVVGTQKNGTVDVIDNGHSAEAKPSGDNTCKVNKSDDDDDDGGKESNARPLLSDSENRDGEGIEVEIEEVEVMQVIQQAEDAETLLSIILQVSVPYLIAGFGTVGAGLVLDVVQHKPVFTAVNELFILVPALLGLKGNLEMTLASRLSTQANLGNMDTKREKLKMITGNMALIQAQATVVGFLASMFAMVIGWIPKGEFPMEHALLLCASSLFTAAVASFVLGGLMVGVVLLSRKMKINPDNVATPIAASLGDLITLALLAAVSTILYSAIGRHHWLAPVIIGVFFSFLPLWVILALKNKYTNDVIYSGWTPVLSAMVISSLGGVILDYGVNKFRGIAVFQPVINGVGGNLVAIQASRISTYLHRRGHPGEMPQGTSRGCTSPFSFFCGKTVNSRAARALMILVIPGHLLFVYTIYYTPAGHTSITIYFITFYLLAALLQVVLLLYISQWMVHFIWGRGGDPDSVAIPYLTAIGDLLGTGFLTLAFYVLYLMGDKDADLGE